jgi:hypothetical protein
MEEFTLNNFNFLVTDSYDEIEFTDKQQQLLHHPSYLNFVLLCNNWWKQTYRLLNFTGTTNEEAIKKILVFYKHKTFRRLIGDHIFFEGFNITSNGVILNLGS